VYAQLGAEPQPHEEPSYDHAPDRT
jgi:hypothetical protein